MKLALLLLTTPLILAIPLNINLGAYSPALVVGDGAIEFEGAETAATTTRPQSFSAPQAFVAPQAASAPLEQEASAPEPPTPRPTKVLEPRDLAGFDKALRYAEVGLEKGPDIQLGTGAGGSGVGVIVDNNQAARVGGVVVVTPR
ncbi:hypothetical protein OQA88_2911 [Cercophora sp. LCS_1]